MVDKTIILIRTSKKVKEVVDKMYLSSVVRLNRRFWDDTRNGTETQKRQFLWRQLTTMIVRCLSPHSNCATVQLQDHIQSGLQDSGGLLGHLDLVLSKEEKKKKETERDVLHHF